MPLNPKTLVPVIVPELVSNAYIHKPFFTVSVPKTVRLLTLSAELTVIELPTAIVALSPILGYETPPSLEVQDVALSHALEPATEVVVY
jgi:hypothetical protein